MAIEGRFAAREMDVLDLLMRVAEVKVISRGSNRSEWCWGGNGDSGKRIQQVWGGGKREAKRAPPNIYNIYMPH